MPALEPHYMTILEKLLADRLAPSIPSSFSNPIPTKQKEKQPSYTLIAFRPPKLLKHLSPLAHVSPTMKAKLSCQNKRPELEATHKKFLKQSEPHFQRQMEDGRADAS